MQKGFLFFLARATCFDYFFQTISIAQTKEVATKGMMKVSHDQ
jgi:hypothetical protein